jgi:hypothetical protein
MMAAVADVALYLLLKMHIFVVWGKTTLNVSSFLLAAKNCYYAKGCWTLRQRYPECRAALKVFNRPRLNMVL